MLRVRKVPRALRFGLVSLLVVACLGVGLGFFLTHQVRTRAISNAEELASTVSAVALQRELEPADFDPGRANVAREVQLAQRLAPVMAAGDIIHVNVFDTAARVVWSDRAHEIGEQDHLSDELTSALRGAPASEFTTLADGSPALEVYVPVTFDAAVGPVGAFELYLPYTPVAEAVRRDTVTLLAVLIVSLLGVWLVLALLVETATRAVRRSQEENLRLARTDALTGLPNRAVLEDALGPARRGQESLVSVLLVDVDRFTDINEAFGHKVGDDVLRLVAEVLRATAGRRDLVARLAADEFAVVHRGDGGEDLARQVLEALTDLELPVAGSRVPVRASMGISTAVRAEDRDALLQQADAAMRAAKVDGGGLSRWEPSMADRKAERLLLMSELRPAILSGELRLLMQPSIDLSTGAPTGAEALVRWQHPRLGLLAPDVFVPLAEQSDLIEDLTAWVLDEAVRQCASWVAAGEDLKVAVNLSARDLGPGLPSLVAETLGRHGLDAGRLCLELTETSLPRSIEVAAQMLGAISALGVSVAVDDFGTGFATLAWLRQLPFDTLKIDRSFVAGLADEPGARELVRHVVALGRGLGMHVVGEGVETEEQGRVLAGLGCDTAQGYHFARPLPAEDLLAWVRTRQPAGAGIV